MRLASVTCAALLVSSAAAAPVAIVETTSQPIEATRSDSTASELNKSSSSHVSIVRRTSGSDWAVIVGVLGIGVVAYHMEHKSRCDDLKKTSTPISNRTLERRRSFNVRPSPC